MPLSTYKNMNKISHAGQILDSRMHNLRKETFEFDDSLNSNNKWAGKAIDMSSFWGKNSENHNNCYKNVT